MLTLTCDTIAAAMYAEALEVEGMEDRERDPKKKNSQNDRFTVHYRHTKPDSTFKKSQQ